MTHQRNGQLVVCSSCQDGNCAGCIGTQGSARCHCTSCQPLCPRPECNRTHQRQVVNTEVCDSCYTVKSLTNVCNCP